MWSVGCIFGELIKMIKKVCSDALHRFPLFPGKYCYPVSPNTLGVVFKSMNYLLFRWISTRQKWSVSHDFINNWQTKWAINEFLVWWKCKIISSSIRKQTEKKLRRDVPSNACWRNQNTRLNFKIWSSKPTFSIRCIEGSFLCWIPSKITLIYSRAYFNGVLRKWIKSYNLKIAILLQKIDFLIFHWQ